MWRGSKSRPPAEPVRPFLIPYNDTSKKHSAYRGRTKACCPSGRGKRVCADAQTRPAAVVAAAAAAATPAGAPANTSDSCCIPASHMPYNGVSPPGETAPLEIVGYERSLNMPLVDVR